ncbi:MAG: fatty acid--CoA ligase family protein [Saprospiraceae bacterium]|nr:fatty acid--CoA ligase family protein [Saprospiraceae bacterium]
MLDVLLDRIISHKDKTFLIRFGQEYTYRDLLVNIEEWQYLLRHVQPGSVVVHQGGYELNNIGLLLALTAKKCIAVPVSSSGLPISDIIEITGASILIDPELKTISMIDPMIIPRFSGAGIIFFTSGSSGKPKAALHNFDKLLEKYTRTKKAFRTCSVLLFDHLAGFDNLFYVLFSGGCLIVPDDFSPAQVLKVVSNYGVQVLSATPSFLNFMLLQHSELRQAFHDLEIIVFSSEKMPESTLQKLKNIIPEMIRLIQKYGSTEMGSPSSRTHPDNPRLLKFDPAQVEFKIIDSILYLKSSLSFLGYLNYENQMQKDGWYCTGDLVEREGEWLHILGRETDMINVGGRKVFPQEVEDVLMGMDNVIDASVSAKEHPLLGEVVKATIALKEREDMNLFKNRMRKYCHGLLAPYKIPVYLEIVEQAGVSDRMKKVRK